LMAQNTELKVPRFLALVSQQVLMLDTLTETGLFDISSSERDGVAVGAAVDILSPQNATAEVHRKALRRKLVTLTRSVRDLVFVTSTEPYGEDEEQAMGKVRSFLGMLKEGRGRSSRATLEAAISEMKDCQAVSSSDPELLGLAHGPCPPTTEV
jgi:hypothetical protein